MRVYYHLFYKIYRSTEYTSELGGGKFWTDLKTVIIICILEVLIFFSFFNYYSLITKTKFNLSFQHPIIIFPLLLIIIVNYLLFIHTDKWKEYNEEFDKLSKRKNKIGGLIVLVIVIFILANYFLSAYYMQKIVWGNV